jgi:hypothetical protein
MLKFSQARQVAAARKAGAEVVAHGVTALETSTHNAVSDAAELVKVLLDFHGAAKLPPAAGTDVLELIQEAAGHAAKSRAATALAHEKLRALAKQHRIEFMGHPQCDENERNF